MIKKSIEHIKKYGLTGFYLKSLDYAVIRIANQKKIKSVINFLNSKTIVDQEEIFHRFCSKDLFQNIDRDEADLLPSRFKGRKPYILSDQTLPKNWNNRVKGKIISIDSLSDQEIGGGIF